MKRLLFRSGIALAIAAALLAAYTTQSDSAFSAALVRGWKQLAHRTPSVAANDVVVRVVFDGQDHALSCEAASLKMVLAAKEVAVTETDIMDAIGTDPTPRTIRNGSLIWGDPNRGFVGNIDGRMPSSGYGVHWSPVAKAARRWRNAEVVEQASAALIASHIRQGNPFIAWGFTGAGRPYSWMTPDGTTINTVLHEHVYVVHGYRGSAGAPEGFYVTDPIYGLTFVTADELMQNMAPFGASGVVVF
jgi:uncharacterized protein YvpB